MPYPARLGGAALRGLTGLGILGLALVANGQLPQCRLGFLFPPGARIGTTNEVAVGGSDLDEAAHLIFSDPRVTGVASGNDGRTQRVIVPPNVPAGPIEVRLAGRFGVSNPRVFLVGNQPEVTVPPTNGTAATAVEVALGTVVNSRTQPNQSLWFRGRAEPGQRLIARVVSRELDSRLVPDLVVLDSQGVEVAVARRKNWLDFVAPADGTFVFRLNDQTYRGGDDFGFRLEIGRAPHLEFAVPEVLRAGETNAVTLFGRLLPGSRQSNVLATDGRPWEELDVSIVAPAQGSTPISARKPASATLARESFPWIFEAGGLQAEPLIFTLTTQPVTVASWKADSGEISTFTAPGELTGLFPPRGAAPVATFEAAKGDTYSLELLADRLGIRADPWALVQRIVTNKSGQVEYKDVVELGDADTNLGGREFDTSTRDATARFQAPESGSYLVRLRDLFQAGRSLQRLPFWLSVRRETPDFRLAVFPQPPPRLNDTDKQIHLWTTVLRRAETVPVRVILFRRDGFEGEVELVATNLPPGVTAIPTRIPAGQNAASLLLTAAPDAAAGNAAIAIVGRTRVGDQDLVREAVPASSSWHITDWDLERGNGRPALTLAVSVCGVETAPVAISTAATNAFESLASAKLPLAFSVRRQDTFPAAFKARIQGHPEIEKLKEFDIAEKATNATFELNLADTKLAPGTYALWVQGMVPGKYRNNPEGATQADAEFKEAEKAVSSASTEGKSAAEERKKMAEARKKAAEERAKPRDVTVAVYSQPFTLKVLPPPAAAPAEAKK